MTSCCNMKQGSSAPPRTSSAGQQRSSSKTQPASCPRCQSAACCCCSQHTRAPGLAAHCTSPLAAAVPARLPESGTPQPERTFPLARYSLQQLATVMHVSVCVARPAVQQCSVCLPVYGLQYPGGKQRSQQPDSNPHLACSCCHRGLFSCLCAMV
jgi:hypothetical protein